MKHLLTFLCAACCALVLIAAVEPGARAEVETPFDGRPRPWTDKPLANEAGRFHFAIVSDLTGGERPGVFDKAVGVLNLLQPELVMSVGDYVQGYSGDAQRVAGQWDGFAKRLDKLEMRFFMVPGNHDVAGPAAAVSGQAWAERFGPTYYHFIYRDTLFVCLNSELLLAGQADRAAAGRQMEYLKKTLAEHAQVRWTFVFLHRPLWGLEPRGPWTEVAQLLNGRKHTVFAGHVHRYTKVVRNGMSYISLATTGGANGPAVLKSGQFDGVAWVTLTPRGPVIANVLVDGVLDDNVLTEEAIRAQLDGITLPKEIAP